MMNKTLLAILLMLFGSAAAFGQGAVPIGDEFLVNGDTSNRQSDPVIEVLSGGDFVVVWERLRPVGAGTYFGGLRGRVHRPDGTAIGEEFQVDGDSASSHLGASMARRADDRLVVVWGSSGSSGPDTSSGSIQGRRFEADGTALSGQFQVNSHTSGGQFHPDVGIQSDGGFVVAWTSTTSPVSDSSSWSVLGRRFSPTGTPEDEDFQVNTFTTGTQSGPSVAVLADDRFVVVWHSAGSSGSDDDGWSIQGRRFAGDGTALGAEFQVNTDVAGTQWRPDVAAGPDGGFAVMWASDVEGSAATRSIPGRLFAAPRFALVGIGGKCLDAQGGEPTPGTAVQLYRCHGGENQRWQLDLTPVPQRVRGIGGLCLVPGPAPGSGAPRLEIDECGGGDDLWSLETTGSSKPSVLIHQETGLCLDVRGASTADGTPTILWECHGGANQVWRPAPTACVRDARGLCLSRERFRVEVEWRDYEGNTGSGQVVPVGSDDSGLFWYFDADNWEMLIKVLDGCAINERFWVFAAATTDVEYTLRVTDTAMGAVREYFNPLGTASPAITDAGAFATCSTQSSAPAVAGFSSSSAATASTILDRHARGAKSHDEFCEPSATGLCLNQDRFLVEVEWRDYAGVTGSGRVVPVDSEDSGILWFFSADNWEMLVKVLDGCGINEHFWVFAAATTDVEYRLRVTDVVGGEIREYFNPLGTAAPAITDPHAFAACLD
ncbi:MAG: ricin-type beta-trefoil lectin domain protein [bacterium]|nr:ricin-type beta-trefoil lectin domain protein [bacterium]